MSHLSSLVLVPHLFHTSLTCLVLISKNVRITELLIYEVMKQSSKAQEYKKHFSLVTEYSIWPTLM